MQIDIEERRTRARNLFREGYNCCQSVVMAYSDVIGIDDVLAATISSSFGGGVGRLREVCGAVSGMAVVAGFLQPSVDPADRDAKAKNYAFVQQLAEPFRIANGSIVCRELLGIDHSKDAPVPSERTAEYYKKRPCVELVAMAAGVVGERINLMNNEE